MTKDQLRFDLDSILAEIQDQNTALERLQDIFTKDDEHGLAIIVRSIKENISKQLERLDTLTLELRQLEQ